MGLEAATYLHDLVTTNPVSSDQKSEGDDHLRLLKSVLKNTFPGLAGRSWRKQSKAGNYTVIDTDNMTVIECTAGLTLNWTSAATLGNGHAVVVRANGGDVVIDPAGAELVNGASTVTVKNGSAALVTSDGSGLLALGLMLLNSLVITGSGTFGSILSNGLVDSVVGSGFSYKARRSGGDMLRVAPNAAGSGAQIDAVNSAETDYEPLDLIGELVSLFARTGAASVAKVLEIAAVASNARYLKVLGATSSGNPSLDVSGGNLGVTPQMDLAAGIQIAGASILGRDISASETLVAGDANKFVRHPASDDNARTFTIPANSSVAFAVGTAITFVNRINTLTIAITTDTLIQAGTGSTGSRTLAANGMATALKIGSTEWIISGTGMS